MDVTTDGTIDPESAVKSAADILVGGFKILAGIPDTGPEEEPVKPKRPSGKIDLTATIEELELPTRVNNALHSAGIETIEDLLNTSNEKLNTIKNLGS